VGDAVVVVSRAIVVVDCVWWVMWVWSCVVGDAVGDVVLEGLNGEGVRSVGKGELEVGADLLASYTGDRIVEPCISPLGVGIRTSTEQARPRRRVLQRGVWVSFPGRTLAS
jgi:hypothetical protein